MPGDEDQPEGMWSRAERLGKALLLALRNRVELFGVEMREEQARVLGLLIRAAVMIFFAFLAVVVLTLAVVWLLRPYVAWALLGFGLVYSGIAFAAARAIRRAWLEGPAPFQESLNELKKDVECLTSRE